MTTFKSKLKTFCLLLLLNNFLLNQNFFCFIVFVLCALACLLLLFFIRLAFACLLLFGLSFVYPRALVVAFGYEMCYINKFASLTVQIKNITAAPNLCSSSPITDAFVQKGSKMWIAAKRKYIQIYRKQNQTELRVTG